MVIVGRGDLFECPPQVCHEEGRGASNRGKLIVIEEDDSPGVHEMPEVDEVEEHSVEAMIAVDEAEVEAPALLEESRQHDLRILSVVLDELRDPRLVKGLQAAVGEPRRLVRVDDDVPRASPVVREQAFEDNSAEMPYPRPVSMV